MKVEISNKVVEIDEKDWKEFGERIVIAKAHGHCIVMYFDYEGVGVAVKNPKMLARKILGGLRKDEYVIPKNGNWLNIRRDNLLVVGREYFNRNRRVTRYKGVSFIGGMWQVSVYLNETQKVLLRLKAVDGDEYGLEASKVYDAMLDYIGIKGYKNHPDCTNSLTESQRSKIKSTLHRLKYAKSKNEVQPIS